MVLTYIPWLVERCGHPICHLMPRYLYGNPRYFGSNLGRQWRTVHIGSLNAQQIISFGIWSVHIYELQIDYNMPFC